RSPPFPYTTLFRSELEVLDAQLQLGQQLPRFRRLRRPLETASGGRFGVGRRGDERRGDDGTGNTDLPHAFLLPRQVSWRPCAPGRATACPTIRGAERFGSAPVARCPRYPAGWTFWPQEL